MDETQQLSDGSETTEMPEYDPSADRVLYTMAIYYLLCEYSAGDDFYVPGYLVPKRPVSDIPLFAGNPEEVWNKFVTEIILPRLEPFINARPGAGSLAPRKKDAILGHVCACVNNALGVLMTQALPVDEIRQRLNEDFALVANGRKKLFGQGTYAEAARPEEKAATDVKRFFQNLKWEHITTACPELFSFNFSGFEEIALATRKEIKELTEGRVSWGDTAEATDCTKFAVSAARRSVLFKDGEDDRKDLLEAATKSTRRFGGLRHQVIQAVEEGLEGEIKSFRGAQDDLLGTHLTVSAVELKDFCDADEKHRAGKYCFVIERALAALEGKEPDEIKILKGVANQNIADRDFSPLETDLHRLLRCVCALAEAEDQAGWQNAIEIIRQSTHLRSLYGQLSDWLSRGEDVSSGDLIRQIMEFFLDHIDAEEGDTEEGGFLVKQDYGEAQKAWSEYREEYFQKTPVLDIYAAIHNLAFGNETARKQAQKMLHAAPVQLTRQTILYLKNNPDPTDVRKLAEMVWGLASKGIYYPDRFLYYNHLALIAANCNEPQTIRRFIGLMSLEQYS